MGLKGDSVSSNVFPMQPPDGPNGPVQPPGPANEQPPFESEPGAPLSQLIKSFKLAQPAKENKSVASNKERKLIFTRGIFFNLCLPFYGTAPQQTRDSLPSGILNYKQKIE